MSSQLIDFNLLEKLIKAKSTPDNRREQQKCILIAKEYIEKKIDVQVELHEVNGCLSLVARRNIKAKVSLIGHLDVVTGQKKLFHPKKVGKKIVGRGVYDMKGPVCALIASFIELANINKPVELILTTDEETGGTNGVAALVEKKVINPFVALIPDGLCDNDIVIAQKGPAHLFIEARGKSVHASRSWDGINAIDKLWGCLDEITNTFHRARNGFEWLPTATVTRFISESSINQVPDRAEACIDVRITEKEHDWLNVISDICLKHGCKIFRKHGDGKVFTLNTSRFISRWKRISYEVTGKRVGELFSCGSSDARHLPKETVSIITSVEGGDAHGDKEWVRTDSLDQLRQTATQFVRESF